jgi:two-component system sensor histidine kinase VicK
MNSSSKLNVDLVRPGFLSGGGEMGRLIRDYDWSETPIGAIEHWPKSLQMTLSILLHSAFPMFLFWGKDFLCFYNDAYRPSLGENGKHPAIGKKGKEVWPEIWDFIGPLIDRVINTGEPVWFEDQLVPIYRNGKIEDVWWTFSYSAVYGDDEQVSGVFVTCTETTQKVLNLVKLAESEMRYNKMLMQSPFAFAIFKGKAMMIALANDTMKEVLGKGADIEGRPLLEVLPELREQQFPSLLDDVYTTGIPYSANETLIKLYRNGKIEDAYFNFVYQPYREVDDSISGITVIAYECTNEVMAKHKIAESEERFRTLAETLPQLVWITNENGEQEYASSRWQEYSGITPTGTNTWQQIVHPEDMPVVAEAWISSMKTGRLYRTEIRLKNKEGNYRWHFAQGEPIRNDKGKIIKWIGAFTDIHDQKTIAENLEHVVTERTKELQEKNMELQTSIDLLHSQELKDVQKNNFIAMASHELKTPITSIKGYVQLLLTAFDNQKQENKSLPPLLVRSSLISVDKQITRLTRLISELLDLSNIERGTLRLRKDKFSLNELAIETVEDILYTNTTHKINLLHDFKCYVHADKDRIGQVMINFLTNAIKYSPNSDKIDVRIHRAADGEVAFSVKDYGIGIEKDEQKKIFERFYRAKGREEQTYPGFGIGLFIAHEFVLKHGGQMMVESEKGKGSVFTFTLPKVQAE